MQDGGTQGANRTVLLAEDNAAMADVISTAIGNLAEEVVVALDGVEVLDYLFCTGPHEDREPVMPRVVLLDVGMAQMGGLETLERLRADERTRFLPVVMLSSSQKECDLVESYALGANGYVCKSSPIASLPELARTAARFWLLANEPPPG